MGSQAIRELPAEVRLRRALRVHLAAVVTPVPRVQDDDGSVQGLALRSLELLSQWSRRKRAVGSEPVQCCVRTAPEDAVLCDPVLTLECAYRAVGIASEDPVFATGIESQRVETGLKREDVVTAQQWDA